jgi:hypothetical protein
VPREVIQIGSSLAVTLSKDIVDQLGRSPTSPSAAAIDLDRFQR